MRQRTLQVILALLCSMIGSGLPTMGSNAPTYATYAARASMLPTDQAHAELSNHELEMNCMPPQVMTIGWTTVLEENVAGYKVHRHSLDGKQEHAWVSAIPLAAHGPGGYRILDVNAVPNRRYLYRLYAFDASYQLSQAEQIILANPAQPTCLHLPIARHMG